MPAWIKDFLSKQFSCQPDKRPQAPVSSHRALTDVETALISEGDGTTMRLKKERERNAVWVPGCYPSARDAPSLGH
jgi:hypothetical protein